MQLCLDRVIANGALAAVAQVAARHALGAQIMLVCDDTTYEVAGKEVAEHLRATCKVNSYSLGRHVHATLSAATTLIERMKGFSGIVAVGSGTVNDISKYAAHALGVPYICVATAASMNGYSSATASLIAEGMKQSFSATPPRAVIVDMDIIAAAPKRLARAGVGDTLCRTTVEADCLLSHHLLGTPYPRAAFDALRAHESVLIGDIGLLKENAPRYYTVLMQALLDGGDAMARAGSSITASQGEHMIAHTMEMVYGDEIDAYHGEVIAVTLLTMNDLQNKLLLGTPQVRSLPRDEAYMARIFNHRMAPHVAKLYARKVLDAGQVAHINEKFTRDWPEIKRELSDVVIQNFSLERAYIHGNMPMKPADIHINEDRYNAALTYAYLTRDRFTFLDLAQMMGRRA